MTTPTILPPGKTIFVDSNGNPLVGGTVSFYVPGTLTPKTTWQDVGQTVVNPNPIELDGAGGAVVFGSGQYRQIVRDALGNQIWDSTTGGGIPNVGDLVSSVLHGVAAFTNIGATHWTVPDGVTAVDYWLTGGGGAGGACGGFYAGGGGGAGGTAIGSAVVTPGQTITITIGAGGAALAAGVTGQNGGSSSFGSFATALGGAGGGSHFPSSAGGNGGYASGDATLLIHGGTGGDGEDNPPPHPATGNGGASYWGGGYRAGSPDATGTAAWGAGGAGGYNGSSNTSIVGSATGGQNGALLLRWLVVNGVIVETTGTPDPTIVNVAALRALAASPPVSSLVNVEGYSAAGDNGGGTFVYVPTDTTSADNGGSVIVDAAGNRWHRQFQTSLTAREFGAAGDGTNDDTASIQALATAAFTAGLPAVIEPTSSGYVVSAPLTGAGIFQMRNVSVNTNAYLDYGGIQQSELPTLAPLSISNAEAFGQSFRNSSITAYNIYSTIGTPGFYDGLQGVTLLPNGSTTINQATGVAGYVKNRAAQVANNVNGVALFGAGTAEVDSGATWGINTLLQDAVARTVGTGTGRKLLNEFDFNVMNPHTSISGLNLTGSSLAQPVSANGLGILPIGNGFQWNNGILSVDGAAPVFAGIGRQSATPGANAMSQLLSFLCTDGSGNTQSVSEFSQGSGTLIFKSFVASNNLAIQCGGNNPAGYWVGAFKVVGPQISGWGAPLGGTRAQLNPSTATLSQVASALNALIFDLLTHGLIAP